MPFRTWAWKQLAHTFPLSLSLSLSFHSSFGFFFHTNPQMAIFTLNRVLTEWLCVTVFNTVPCFPLQRGRLKHAVSLRFMRNISQDLLSSESVCVCVTYSCLIYLALKQWNNEFHNVGLRLTVGNDVFHVCNCLCLCVWVCVCLWVRALMKLN